MHERTVGQHVATMINSRWVKITSEWTPREGKGVRGSPKRSWKDNIEEVGSSNWMMVAIGESAGVNG